MNRTGLVISSGLALLVVGGIYKSLSPQGIPVHGVMLAAGQPPQCRYGLEPGGGPMRCADPNDPTSYLYKKAKQAERQPKTDGYTLSPDGKEIITPDGKHWARRPAWMPSPKEDPRFCTRVTHSASDLNRCVQIQNQEFLPSQADYANALRQQAAFLDRLLRDMCIHGDRAACRRSPAGS